MITLGCTNRTPSSADAKARSVLQPWHHGGRGAAAPGCLLVTTRRRHAGTVPGRSPASTPSRVTRFRRVFAIDTSCWSIRGQALETGRAGSSATRPLTEPTARSRKHLGMLPRCRHNAILLGRPSLPPCPAGSTQVLPRLSQAIPPERLEGRAEPTKIIREPAMAGHRPRRRAEREYRPIMVSTVAVLSDTHGVLPVLQAVLAEPDVAAAELVVVCGDLAAGPMPVETLDALAALGDRGLLVRGNADRELVAVADGSPSRHPESTWAGAQLRPDQVDLLRGLPHPVTVDVDGFGPVLFCHGSPRDDDEVVLVDTRLARWAEAFADVPDEVRTILCGHTHMPFARLVDRRWVVNPGSVGMPYGRVGGSWVLMRDGQISLRHTEIDVEATCAEVVRRSAYPQVAEWVDEYVRGRNSDVDALTAFGPRDGRTA
jgi:predicted phosphodiesterase